MGERQEDPLRKMKKMEKSQVSNHREYLDMDTDEEEFGRQETPEPEEEIEPEPDKPIFTKEELNTLANYIKDFTTLSNLLDSDWSCEVVEIVEEYFKNPGNIVLTIFRDSGILRASLDFPEFTDDGLTYFIRADFWQIYTTDNFLSTVIFGSVDDAIENSTLKFFNNLYAPIAFRSNYWPNVMRNEIFSDLHKFLMCLTDATYNPMGLTILYVPREGLKDDKIPTRIIDEELMEDIDEKINEIGENEEEGLIERLERIARYWIRQIRESINGKCSFEKFSSPCKTIVDEILYWHYRYENLSCIHEQLTNKTILSIVEKLEFVRSSSVKQYNPLFGKIRDLLEEAKSNITYLNLFEEFSDGFEIPDGVEKYATRILLTIRFVGNESPYFRGVEKIETLCREFCSQMIDHLQRSIDLDVIYEGNANVGRKMILKCINCCEKFNNIHERILEMDGSSDSPIISLTQKNNVFNHVDTFLQRCNDLIGIVDARIAFEKSEKSINIRGPRGIKLAKHYRNIEEHFNATLKEIKNNRDDFLDVVSAKWLDRIIAFKRGIKNVENMVKNWINVVFEDIMNVEEGIETLHEIQRFSRRSNLRDTLNDKWIQIWKIFGNELESYSIIMNMDPEYSHNSSLPRNANIIRSNEIYFTRHYKMLIDASDWFGDCEAQSSVTQKYKRVLAAMNQKEEILFAKWQNHISENKIKLETISTTTILKYNENTKTKTIEINLDNDCLESLREISEWTILGYETKNIFSKNTPKWETLKFRYNKVQFLCKMYNVIYETITELENLLFSLLLDDLEITISSGFKKTTWMSESFERFFTDSVEAITKIQECLETFRSIDRKITFIIEEIETTSLVNRDKNLIEILEDTKINLERERIQGAEKVGKKCKIILKLLLKSKMIINTNEAQILNCWNRYLANIYEKLKKSFTKCLRLSLSSTLEFLRCDDFTERSQLDDISIDSNKIREMEGEIARINGSTFDAAFPIEEFSRIFEQIDESEIFLNSIDKDQKCISLRKKIEEFFAFIKKKYSLI